MVGIPAPATVGALVSLKTEFVAVPDVAAVVESVVTKEEAVVEAEVDVEDAAVLEVCVVLPVMVLRFGRSVVAGSATASALMNDTRASKSKPAAATFIRLCGRITI